MQIDYLVLTIMQDEERLKVANQILLKHPKFNIRPALFWKTDEDRIFQVFKNTNIEVKRYNVNCGKLGCWASYISLFDEYKNKDADYLVVLQDDAVITPKFESDLYQHYINNNYMDKIYSARLGQYMTGTIFRKKFFDLFFDSIHINGIIKPLDHYLVNVQRQPYPKQVGGPLMLGPNKYLVKLHQIYKKSNITN